MLDRNVTIDDLKAVFVDEVDEVDDDDSKDREDEGSVQEEMLKLIAPGGALQGADSCCTAADISSTFIDCPGWSLGW